MQMNVFALYISIPVTEKRWWMHCLLMVASASGLNGGSYLSVEKQSDILVSPSRVFTAGFFSVGENAFCFSIWFSEPDKMEPQTVVWMANRDYPVNGKQSKLSLLESGNLILDDAGKYVVWETKTIGISCVLLCLHDSGNLVLSSDGDTLWQSFNFPTDTLLPLQPFTKFTQLVSSTTVSNVSSGFYRFFFDSFSTLRLIYDTPDASSVYWHDPWIISWEAGRSTNNNSRIAMLDSLGDFSSSDNFTFRSADYGAKNQRRLRMDVDGNMRVYSREKAGDEWVVSWQAIQEPCKVHGICGQNSFCKYDHIYGRKCSCVIGHMMRDVTDWSLGCEPQFNLSNNDDDAFVVISRVQFYGYSHGYFPNHTYEQCKSLCLRLYGCIAFQLFVSMNSMAIVTDNEVFHCFLKETLQNGYQSPSYRGDLYLRMPKSELSTYDSPVVEFQLSCPGPGVMEISRTYIKNKENKTVKVIISFIVWLGVFELVCIIFIWWFLIRTQRNSNPDYLLASTGFQRFTFAELKKATKDFSEKIGSGAGGVVYKATLPDLRVAAVKRLPEAKQAEAEFFAEASTIGRLNHMFLIQMWGYCAEGKHRLLVYEFMEQGSLAINLSSKTLDWRRRFEIALGTAKGLAYLHEECLEWVLHCDVKPQNILLDANYSPKVADFGMSKLLNRGEPSNLDFSRVRGTRGYMAPEWLYNLPITSKVDVYSYGVVLLELVTGNNPMERVHDGENDGERDQRRMLAWIRGKINDGDDVASWMDEIVDPSLLGDYDAGKMEALVKVAVKCLREDRDERPTMGQVVEMLLS